MKFKTKRGNAVEVAQDPLAYVKRFFDSLTAKREDGERHSVLFVTLRIDNEASPPTSEEKSGFQSVLHELMHFSELKGWRVSPITEQLVEQQLEVFWRHFNYEHARAFYGFAGRLSFNLEVLYLEYDGNRKLLGKIWLAYDEAVFSPTQRLFALAHYNIDLAIHV